jgi:hypothetical protein
MGFMDLSSAHEWMDGFATRIDVPQIPPLIEALQKVANRVFSGLVLAWCARRQHDSSSRTAACSAPQTSWRRTSVSVDGPRDPVDGSEKSRTSSRSGPQCPPMYLASARMF